MIDCLADTGLDPVLPFLVGGVLVAAGVAAVLLLRRKSRPGRTGRGATLGLVLVLALGLSVVAATGAPASAVAAAPCPAAATAAPTPPPGPPAILPDEEVTFTSGDVAFAASYRGPADVGSPVAAAVIIGGTGAIDRNGNAATLATEDYSWMADLLSAQGIASIRYDKLGTGATGLGPYTADPAAMLPLSYDRLRVQPARDALSYLAGLPGIDATRLILIGHSEGGAAALTIAHDLGSAPPIAGLALIEPAYTHILDIVTRQFAEQMDGAVAGGAMTAPDADTLKAWMAAGVDQIRTGTPPFPAPGPVPLPAATDYTALIQSTIESNIYGSDPAQMVVTHAYRTAYGQGYDAIDPAAAAPSITVPTLITCGTKDFNTPCGDGTSGSGVIALAGAFAPGVAEFVQLPDTVHILRDVGANDVPNLPDQLAYPFSTVLASAFNEFAGRFAEPGAP